jgi:hypothetical protein
VAGVRHSREWMGRVVRMCLMEGQLGKYVGVRRKEEGEWEDQVVVDGRY